MDIQTLTSFFMWCAIINASLLTFWTIIFVAIPDFVYRTQSIFFPIPRETFNMAIYAFLALFKIFVLFFNVVPFVALLIVG